MNFNKLFAAILLLAGISFAACDKVPNEPQGPTSGIGQKDTTAVTTSDTLSVAQAIAKQDNNPHFVKGVIVGWYSNHLNDKKVIFSAEGTADTTVLQTNIVIAETAEETDQTKCLCVQLTAGPIRTALNLKEHADNLHKVVILQGTLTSYNSLPGLKEPSMAILDGKTIKNSIDAAEGAAGTGTEADPFNVAAAINKCIETGQTPTTEQYYVKGIVKEIKEEVSTQYGNVTFTMVDEGKEALFTAYRVKGPGDVKFTAPVTKAGDVVVLKAQLVNYKGNTPETSNGGQLLIVNDKPLEGDTTSKDTTQTGVYASTIAWTNGTNAYNDGVGTVNDEANVVIYKLSTSKNAGNATLTIPAGVTKIGFYAVAWKGATNTVLKVGEEDVAVKANDGATGNSPYTLTVTEQDYYEVNVTEGSLALSCPARVLLFAITAKNEK